MTLGLRSIGRGLARDRRFFCAVALLFALGVGICVAFFSVVDPLLFRQLPYPQASDLFMLSTRSADGTLAATVAADEMEEVRSRHARLVDLASFTPAQIRTLNGGPAELSTVAVSPTFFSVLRVRPALGTLFDREQGGGPVRPAVLTYSAWRQHYGSDPRIVGTLVETDEESFAITGVLPSTFLFPSPLMETWT